MLRYSPLLLGRSFERLNLCALSLVAAFSEYHMSEAHWRL